QHPLQLAVAGDGRQLLLVGDPTPQRRRLGGRRLEVGADPGPRPLPEALDVLDLGVAVGGDRGLLARHAARSLSTTMSATRWRWSAGVPNSVRFTVWRRRNRCRSCSNVTPMPPCSCTQSCSSSDPRSPMYARAA